MENYHRHQKLKQLSKQTQLVDQNFSNGIMLNALAALENLAIYYGYKGKRIFEQRNISGVIKITPNEEFLRQFEFRLLLDELSATDTDGFIYCKDQGKGKLLKISLTFEQ